MAVKIDAYRNILKDLEPAKATLVAVSKVRTPEEILELYQLGQRDFGENYVQELVDKYEKLPKDIRWHFIGHLQSNKVKNIAPFIHLIHGADRPNLLKEINKQALRNRRKIDCLLQVHIAEEDTKFGFEKDALKGFLSELASHGSTPGYPGINFVGLMGMATFTFDEEVIRNEFRTLKELFDSCFSAEKFQTYNAGAETNFSPILSMGMSADYKAALREGSNMVRIGSLLFGPRI